MGHHAPTGSDVYRAWFVAGSVQRGCFPGAPAVKNPPATRETWRPLPGQEDPLEEEMATYSSILAWEIPWTEEPGRVQSMGLPRI